MLISSNSNERVKELKKLVKSAKERNNQNLYIVEGIRMFVEIPKDKLIDVYVSETALSKYEDKLWDKLPGEYYILTDNVFKAVADTDTPQGILATVKQDKYELKDVICENPCFLIVDHLQDPGNMGTIIRSSEAAGVTGIIVSPDSVDVYNPKVVRSTMGSIFRVPVIKSKDLVEDINTLKACGVTIFGAHLDGANMYEMNFKKASAFLIGNEGNGLSEEISKTADELLKIPMQGAVESLNAAVSASIIAYEVLRQRL